MEKLHSHGNRTGKIVKKERCWEEEGGRGGGEVNPVTAAISLQTIYLCLDFYKQRYIMYRHAD